MTIQYWPPTLEAEKSTSQRSVTCKKGKVVLVHAIKAYSGVEV